MDKETSLSQENEISLATLWGTFTKNVIWILLFATVIGGAVGAYTKFLKKTTYEANINYAIVTVPSSGTEQQSGTSLTSGQSYFSGASVVAENCGSFVMVRPTLIRIIEEADLTVRWECDLNEAIKKLTKLLTFSHESNEIFFTVKVAAKTAEEVKVIGDAVKTVLSDDTYGFNSLFKAQTATVSCIDAEPNTLNNRDIVEVKSSTVKNTAIAFAAALVVAYAIFFVFDLLDKLVYDEKELKEHFKFPILGCIPDWYAEGEKRSSRSALDRLLHRPKALIDADSERNYDTKLLSPDTPFAISEAFNQLRTNVEYSKKSGETPVYAVTSAYSGVGKSLVMANLALSFANLGKKTLLVEGDMRLPVFHKIFNVDKKSFGLSELLAGIEHDASKVTKNFAENLDVIPSGHIPPNPSELLGQMRMKELVAEWKEKYDIVFIDMPPIGEVTDAGIVADTISGYVIVARSEYSDIPSISDMVQNIENVNGTIVGFVINDLNRRSGGKYYYQKNYYYGHYYGKAYAKANDSAKKSK